MEEKDNLCKYVSLNPAVMSLENVPGTPYNDPQQNLNCPH